MAAIQYLDRRKTSWFLANCGRFKWSGKKKDREREWARVEWEVMWIVGCLHRFRLAAKHFIICPLEPDEQGSRHKFESKSNAYKPDSLCMWSALVIGMVSFTEWSEWKSPSLTGLNWHPIAPVSNSLNQSEIHFVVWPGRKQTGEAFT